MNTHTSVNVVNRCRGRYDVALWATISDFPYSWPLWQRFSSKFVATQLVSKVQYSALFIDEDNSGSLLSDNNDDDVLQLTKPSPTFEHTWLRRERCWDIVVSVRHVFTSRSDCQGKAQTNVLSMQNCTFYYTQQTDITGNS